MEDKSLHDRIIDCAYEMFAQRGVKSVTMDAISAELAISKRTLYEEFSSKTQLVESIVYEMNNFYKKRNDEIMKLPVDAVEKIFLIASINNERNSKDELFFGDIINNYPALIDKLIMTEYQSSIDRVLTNVEQGSREGLFYGDINARIAVDLLFDLRLSLNFGRVRVKAKIDIRATHVYAIVFFLRSIATSKGIDRINELCRLNNINIYK